NPNTGELDVTPNYNPVNLDLVNGVFDPTMQISSGIPLDPVDQRAPFTLTFTQPGVYHYTCAVHGPGMSGVVVVSPAGAPIGDSPDAAVGRGQGQLAGGVGLTGQFVDG